MRENTFVRINLSRSIIPNSKHYNEIKENTKGHIRVIEVFIKSGGIKSLLHRAGIDPKFVVM